jgi:hypothetical protein
MTEVVAAAGVIFSISIFVAQALDACRAALVWNSSSRNFANLNSLSDTSEFAPCNTMKSKFILKN